MNGQMTATEVGNLLLQAAFMIIFFCIAAIYLTARKKKDARNAAAAQAIADAQAAKEALAEKATKTKAAKAKTAKANAAAKKK